MILTVTAWLATKLAMIVHRRYGCCCHLFDTCLCLCARVCVCVWVVILFGIVISKPKTLCIQYSMGIEICKWFRFFFLVFSRLLSFGFGQIFLRLSPEKCRQKYLHGMVITATAAAINDIGTESCCIRKEKKGSGKWLLAHRTSHIVFFSWNHSNKL